MTHEFVSELQAPADEVWAAATDFVGINDELEPLMRMTAPRGWRTLSIDRIEPGQRLFRSWLLLLGVVPIDVVVARTRLHGTVLRHVVPLLFAHRHRRLRRRYGDDAAGT